ncbi:MAG: hypothetical protein R3A51_16555 [Nannocystaceae bacterium]|nr:hypothetical protein [Myxococcales bacterium]
MFLAPIVALALACGSGDGGPTAGSDGSTSETGASESSSASTASSDSTTDPTGSDSGSSDGVPDSPVGGNTCSLLSQDCPEGEKCVPWNEDGGIFPTGVKCVQEFPNPDTIGSKCTVQQFGSGEDSCEKGSMCLDLDNDGEATCIEFCMGDNQSDSYCMDNNYTCVELFVPVVPLCFRKCDPLVQDCPDGEGCFMDAPMLGAEGFVCMPLVQNLSPGGGVYGEGCIAMSNCVPGYSCVFAENVPDCNGNVYCCTPWCNITEDQPCLEYDEKLNCIPWYTEGTAPPGFEQVGICGIMP